MKILAGFLAILCVALVFERELYLPEKAKARQFAAVIAACANGQSFWIDTTLVKCKPAEQRVER